MKVKSIISDLPFAYGNTILVESEVTMTNGNVYRVLFEATNLETLNPAEVFFLLYKITYCEEVEEKEHEEIEKVIDNYICGLYRK